MSTGEQFFEIDEKVDLSVVIVNHNTKRLLQQCLQSIYDTADGLDFEIFAVDNASTDGSQEMIRTGFPQVRLIANSEAVGFTRAVNKGLAEGRGNCFLICHPDVKFLPDAIQEMLSFLEVQPQVGIVGGNLIFPDGSYNPCSIYRRSVRRELIEFSISSFSSIHKRWPWLHNRIKNARMSFFWDHQSDVESATIWNACMMIKGEVLETVGNFCEEFFVWFSDVDLCYRAKNAGWRIHYLHKPKIIHYERKSGEFLDDMDEVRYKTTFDPAVEKMVDRDRHTLYKRHYGQFYLWFAQAIDIARQWIRHLKWTLRRVLRSRNEPTAG